MCPKKQDQYVATAARVPEPPGLNGQEGASRQERQRGEWTLDMCKEESGAEKRARLALAAGTGA